MTKNILKMELIGRNIEIINATNKDLIGIKGKIIDETQHTIIISQKDKRKTLLKEQITFIVTEKNRRIKIDGKKINKKPEKRI